MARYPANYVAMLPLLLNFHRCTRGRAQIRSRILLLLALLCVAPGLRAAQFRVLMVTETAGWQHESTYAAIPAMHRLAERHDFHLDHKQSAMRLTEEQLMSYDVLLMINTTGDIFNDAEQALIQQFMRAGKGWVGVHAAADTEHDWKWYTDMVNHMFFIHPHVQTAMVNVQDTKFPGLTSWPARRIWTDEYYEYLDGERHPDINYLITVDETTYKPGANWGPKKIGKGHGAFHPVSWYREYDGGRAWYTNFGHVPATFTDADFLAHLYGGIYWAATGTK